MGSKEVTVRAEELISGEDKGGGGGGGPRREYSLASQRRPVGRNVSLWGAHLHSPPTWHVLAGIFLGLSHREYSTLASHVAPSLT